MAEGLEALLRSAQAALSAASATLPSAEERRAEAAAAESLAVSGAGAVAMTAECVVGGLWSRGCGEDRCRCGRAAPEAVAALADRARRGVRVRCDRTDTMMRIQACSMHTWPRSDREYDHNAAARCCESTQFLHGRHDGALDTSA
jgi:hypothetical protein